MPIEYFYADICLISSLSYDKRTVVLVLCKSKDNFTAEYALRDINKPIGVAEYTVEILEKLPKNLKASLSTAQELEAELEKQEILAEEEGSY